MIKVFAMVLFIFVCTSVHSQSIRTIFHWDSTKIKSFKGYGEMFIKGTQLKDQWTAVIGGRGGFLLNRKFAFGGIGAGYINRSDFKGDDLNGDTNADLELKMGSGGIFLEYIHRMEAPVHFSVPVNFTIGNIEITKDGSGDRVESSRVLIIEPGVNIEFNFSKYLIISLTAGYRIAKIKTLTNLRDRDVSNGVVGLAGRFGSF